MSRQRTLEVTPAELLRLAGELQTLALTFPQQPSDEVEAAAYILQAACQRVTACISPCNLLRLPEELLLRMLCTLTARDLAALACSCHALSDGSLCTLIERGAHDALNHQYIAALAVLPPKALPAPARLRWLERAQTEAQRWLKRAHGDRTMAIAHVASRTTRAVWPKSEGVDEPPSSRWIEAVVRFGGEGIDLSVDKHKYTSDAQGDYAEDGVRAALMCFVVMARRTGNVAEDPDSDDLQIGDYPEPTITTGAVLWVADKVPNLEVNDLWLAQEIADQLLKACSNHWKSRDRVGHVYTIGNDSVLAAYRAKALCEPLLRALVAASIERHGPDHAAALSARVVLGETLAAAACVSMDSPTDGRLVRWGTVPLSDADAVLVEALASVRRSQLRLTSTVAARVLSAYAGCLSQQGLFARSAVLLRELLEAFVHQDGGYTNASFGSSEAGLGNQIQALARHTQKAGPEACMAGAELLRVHSTALRTYQDTGEYNLRLLYYEADARLLLSHCRRAEGGVLLAEAEVLARELVTQRKHAWDLAPLSKLLKVLEAQVALGRDGATSAMEECCEAMCTELVATLNSTDGYGGDQLMGSQMREIGFGIGYHSDGSSRSDVRMGAHRLCGIKLRFLQQHKIIERIEAMQRARLVMMRSTGAPAPALLAHGRLLGLLLTQGKWDEASAELCKLSASVCASVDVTDTMADDVEGVLTLRCMFRDADAKEPILTQGCEEAVLRHKVAACQRQYTPDNPQAAKILLALSKASRDLARLLLSTAADMGEAESMARLCASTAKTLLAVRRAGGNDRELVSDALLEYSFSLQKLVEVLRCDAEQTEPRSQELEATLNELIVTLTAQLDLSNEEALESLPNYRRSLSESMIGGCQGRRSEAELELAVLYKRQGNHAGARDLAQRIVSDSSTLPLVRARAMLFLAVFHVTSEDEEPAAPLLDRLAAAESLTSRACGLLSGMLHDQISCKRWTSTALEWSELQSALQLHETVLYGLGREAEAADVARKYNEIFGASDDEGEDQSEEEEGETGAKGKEDGVL